MSGWNKNHGGSEVGPQGPPGPQGPKGDKGDTGPQGPSGSSSSKYYQKNVMFFGDSITAGTWGGTSYCTFAAQILGCNFTNKGSSGAATDRLRAIVQGGTSGGTTYTKPDYSTVDVCTIMIGTNGGVGTSTMADITGYSDYLTYPNTYYGNVGSCIEFILAEKPLMKIYLITPPKTDRGQGQTIVNAMKEIGSYYSIPVIDVDNGCGIGAKNLTVFSPDGTHPEEEGKKKIGTFVAYQMQAL